MRNQLRLMIAGAVVFLPCQLYAQAEPDHHVGKPPARVGRVVFPITCNDKAQVRFERGLVLLHSFWYEEALKTFTNVTTTDPACASCAHGL